MGEKMVMLGPGMYQHVAQPCKECSGEGKTVSEKDKCKTCKGQKVIEQKKTLEIALEPGVPNEHDYILYGEGDEYPGISAGDIYYRISTIEDKRYIRKGADLFMEKKISLV
jgi:DnaJ family protein A protein 2